MLEVYEVGSKLKNIENDQVIKEFEPKLFKLYSQGEKRTIKQSLLRVTFLLMCKHPKMFFIENENREIIHFSWKFSKSLKFKFMNDGDCLIGPCWTDSSLRGKGIYSKVISEIIKRNNKKFKRFLMIVDSDNQSSIKGISKIGATKIMKVRKTKVFKIYKEE